MLSRPSDRSISTKQCVWEHPYFSQIGSFIAASNPTCNRRKLKPRYPSLRVTDSLVLNFVLRSLENFPTRYGALLLPTAAPRDVCGKCYTWHGALNEALFLPLTLPASGLAISDPTPYADP
jgi:hypothetical protein